MKKLIPVNKEDVARGAKPKYKMEDVWPISQEVLEQLRPHCIRCQIAGSIRRGKDLIGDIEIVAVCKPYEFGLLESGIATVVNRWEKVKGKMDIKCKYTQRILPSGIKLDLFMVQEDNWGLHLATRTGSAAYSHQVLAKGWVKAGFRSVDGYLTKDGDKVPVKEEMELYRLIGVKWIEPRYRK